MSGCDRHHFLRPPFRPFPSFSYPNRYFETLVKFVFNCFLSQRRGGGGGDHQVSISCQLIQFANPLILIWFAGKGEFEILTKNIQVRQNYLGVCEFWMLSTKFGNSWAFDSHKHCMILMSECPELWWSTPQQQQQPPKEPNEAEAAMEVFMTSTHLDHFVSPLHW